MAVASQNPPAPTSNLRDTLYGDLPMAKWPSEGKGAPTGEPWASFVKAREAYEDGKKADAIKVWKKIVGTEGLESRHYLQAWHFLREAGESAPATHAKQLLGVVIEVPVEDGLDLLAAYPNGSARYYNYSGAGVVWERPDASMDQYISNLLTPANRILQAIGPWQGARPGAPRPGNLRISMLAPSGLHFGEGPFGALAADPMAKPAVDAAIQLMQQLIAKSQ